jgi:acetyltransferase-like isoleucine patch superfamily enzyme
MISAMKKLRYLCHHYGFKPNELGEIAKLYRGESFNLEDKAYLRLLAISKELCEKYTKLYRSGKAKESIFSLAVSYLKRIKLQKKIFLFSHLNADVRSGFSCVVGAVDLEGVCFINEGVSFSPTCLTVLHKDTVVSPKVNFGSSRFGIIELKESSWVGCSSNIDSGITIGKHSIVAAGAVVKSSIPDSCVALGRPAVNKPLVIKEKDRQPSIYSEGDFLILKNHLKKIGFGKAYKDYVRLLKGETVNVGKPSLGRLFLYSHALSFEYSNPSISLQRKREILQILFPFGGKSVMAKGPLFVDLVGATKLGENVILGSNVSFYGSASLGEGTVLDDNVILASSGHPLDPIKRRFKFSFLHGFISLSSFSSIVIEPHCHLGHDVVVAPSSHIEKEVPADSLVTSSGATIPQIKL